MREHLVQPLTALCCRSVAALWSQSLAPFTRAGNFWLVGTELLYL